MEKTYGIIIASVFIPVSNSTAVKITAVKIERKAEMEETLNNQQVRPGDETQMMHVVFSSLSNGKINDLII